MLTLADLMTAETPTAIRARMLAALTAAGFPTASWAPLSAGGVENLRLDMNSGIGILLPPRIVEMVTGRILPLATGDFLKTLGAKFYGLTQREATFTIQNQAFFLKPGAGGVNYTFTAGQIRVRSDATGNRYVTIDSGQFAPANADLATALMLRVQAEAPGAAYEDQAGTITTMVTAKAGVQCVNVTPSPYIPSPLSVDGISSGTIVVTRVPFRNAPGSIRIRIIASGDVGTATFEFSVDGGVTWVYGGPTAPGIDQGIDSGSTIHLAFSNGATPSFVTGDIFTGFLGDSILQRGRDAETEAAFRLRCSNRWPGLSTIPVAGGVALWAHLASDEVDKVSVDANPNVSGGMIVTIAGSTGPASPAAQIAVEDYIGPRLQGYQNVPAPATTGFTSPAETVTVISAAAFSVVVAGPVSVPKAQLLAAQVTADNAWNAYLAGLPLGGQTGAVVELAVLAQVLADAGAIDIPSTLSALTINGASADATIPVGQVAVPFSTLQASLSWIPA